MRTIWVCLFVLEIYLFCRRKHYRQIQTIIVDYFLFKRWLIIHWNVAALNISFRVRNEPKKQENTQQHPIEFSINRTVANDARINQIAYEKKMFFAINEKKNTWTYVNNFGRAEKLRKYSSVNTHNLIRVFVKHTTINCSQWSVEWG